MHLGSAGILLAVVLAMTACERAPEEPGPPFVIDPVGFDSLDGWPDPAVEESLRAFGRSCKPILARDPTAAFADEPLAGRNVDWQSICRAASALSAEGAAPSADQARSFFETWFQPYRVTGDGSTDGLFTGYYEPLLTGSLEPSETGVPLRRAPGDIVTVDLGSFAADLDGRRVRGRVEGDRLVPYFDRDAIEQSRYLYLEGYLVTSDSSRSAALFAREQARATNTPVALSLSDPNVVRYFRPAFDQLLDGGVDLLFANEDEAIELARGDNLADAVEMFKKIARKFAITRGSEGALLFDGSMEINIKPHPVKAIDTLGAGDMFAGAMLYGLSQGMSFQLAGDLASVASAKMVTQFGPRLRTEQTRELLATFSSGN